MYGSGYEWIPYNINDDIPQGAVITDKVDDAPVLIGRVNHYDLDWHVGPVYCRNKQLTMSINGDLVENQFHILVSRYIPESKLSIELLSYRKV